MTATQIDPRLVAEAIQKLKELKKLKGRLNEVLQQRAAAARKPDATKKRVRVSYGRKEWYRKHLDQAKQELAEAQKRSEQDDLTMNLQRNCRSLGKRLIQAYDVLNLAYDDLIMHQDELIELEEACLDARLQYNEVEQPVTGVQYRILASIVGGNLPVNLIHKFSTTKNDGLTIQCSIGRWHIKYDGTVMQLPMPKSSAVVTA